MRIAGTALLVPQSSWCGINRNVFGAPTPSEVPGSHEYVWRPRWERCEGRGRSLVTGTDCSMCPMTTDGHVGKATEGCWRGVWVREAHGEETRDAVEEGGAATWIHKGR